LKEKESSLKQNIAVTETDNKNKTQKNL